MGKNIRNWAIPIVMTIADFVVFVYYVPIICEAWGANLHFMASSVLLMAIWIESLANMWRPAIRCLRLEHTANLTLPHSFELGRSCRGGTPNV